MRVRHLKASRNDGSVVKTYNVTATLKIAKPDIEKIAKQFKGCVYDPQSSPSADIYTGRCLFRIFSTGAISCFGPSRDTIYKSVSSLFQSLRDLGFEVPEKPTINFESQASVVRLGKKLKLWKALYLLKNAEFSSKGPRLLVYRFEKPKVTMQLFEDGVIICLGARNDQESRRAHARIMRIIDDYGLTV